MPKRVLRSTNEIYHVFDVATDAVVLYAGVSWISLTERHIYVWIVPENLSRVYLRSVRRMLDGLPVRKASAIMDTTKPELLKWVRFVGFEFEKQLNKTKAVYSRKWDSKR